MASNNNENINNNNFTEDENVEGHEGQEEEEGKFLNLLLIARWCLEHPIDAILEFILPCSEIRFLFVRSIPDSSPPSLESIRATEKEAKEFLKKNEAGEAVDLFSKALEMRYYCITFSRIRFL